MEFPEKISLRVPKTWDRRKPQGAVGQKYSQPRKSKGRSPRGAACTEESEGGRERHMASLR